MKLEVVVSEASDGRLAGMGAILTDGGNGETALEVTAIDGCARIGVIALEGTVIGDRSRSEEGTLARVTAIGYDS